MKARGWAVVVLTALIGLSPPTTAAADCGDPGQDPCAGPVPTVDQVVGIMDELTDPNKPAMDKGDIVTPGFSPEEAQTIDDHLNHMSEHGILPFNFVVTDIQAAPADLAGATLSTTGGYRHATHDRPIVLADQNGRWLITHDTAVIELDVFWKVSRRVIFVP